MKTERKKYTGSKFPSFDAPKGEEYGSIGVDIVKAGELTKSEYLYLADDLPAATRRQFTDIATDTPIPGAVGKASLPLTGENIYRIISATAEKVPSPAGREVNRTVLYLRARTGETYIVVVRPSTYIYTARPAN